MYIPIFIPIIYITHSVDALKVIETVYGYHAGMKYAQRLLEAALEQ